MSIKKNLFLIPIFFSHLNAAWFVNSTKVPALIYQGDIKIDTVEANSCKNIELSKDLIIKKSSGKKEIFFTDLPNVSNDTIIFFTFYWELLNNNDYFEPVVYYCANELGINANSVTLELVLQKIGGGWEKQKKEYQEIYDTESCCGCTSGSSCVKCYESLCPSHNHGTDASFPCNLI